ncbi:MAG: sugar phosphate nucleotidyltransferase, partial [Candidatus Actinomarina sp.]|nr:sugar phosphate nucleotidyltransferase [Candidatus Actinomarina sp.]
MSKNIYLLVGGEATRLKPLSEGIPKALLTVKGTSIIDLILDNLEQAGFEKFKLICSIKHKEQWEQYQNQTTRSIELLFE